MTITHVDNKTIYSCLICGHTYIEYEDKTSEGKPFMEQENNITVYEPVIEKIKGETRLGSKKVNHKAYICPICGKLQIEIK